MLERSPGSWAVCAGMRSVCEWREVVADPRADLPSAVGAAGSSTTCPRLASREYCRPTVAGDMEITDSMGNASTKRNGKERENQIESGGDSVCVERGHWVTLVACSGGSQLTWILPKGGRCSVDARRT